MIPIWLLDVDGVINAVTADGIGYKKLRAESSGRGFLIHYRQCVIDFINRVQADHLAEVRWLTTWCDDAAKNLAPAVGLVECSVESSDYPGHGAVWWKAITAKRLMEAEPDRAFVWTDDDLAYANRLGELKWMKGRDKHLLISPDTRRGLDDSHLLDIEVFLNKHAQIGNGAR